jgi:hypothetical protein
MRPTRKGVEHVSLFPFFVASTSRHARCCKLSVLFSHSCYANRLLEHRLRLMLLGGSTRELLEGRVEVPTRSPAMNRESFYWIVADTSVELALSVPVPSTDRTT